MRRGGAMRRVTAGLGSLVVAAGLTTTFALSAGAAPPDGSARVQPNTVAVDDLPNPEGTKRRGMRQAPIQNVLAGRAKVRKRAGSEVAKFGRPQAVKGQAPE